MGTTYSQITTNDIFRPSHLLILALTLCGAHFVRRIIQLRASLAGIKNLPGERSMYGPYTIMSKILPSIPYINRREGWQFRQKHGFHKKYGSDIVSSVYLFNSNPVFLWVADAAAIKKITTNRLEYPKPLQMYRALSLFGPNILTAESDEWKRHRRIAAPSFSERNNRLVYEDTTRITMELFEHWSANQKGVVKVDDAVTFTSKLALMAISAAGFGYRFGWDEMEQAPDGHEMTFQTALSTALNNFILRLVLSDSILRLWKDGRRVVIAFKELRIYMREMIEERRQSASDGADRQADLFTNLVSGTSLDATEKTVDQLSDEELMGNVFIFLFAGHETTAHSLGFTLALLAAHQDIQEKAFQELRNIVPEGEAPTYANVVKWAYGLAITYESLRMFPPVTIIPKYAGQDTILTTTSADGKDTPMTVVVPQGTEVIINVPALHYNPKYWDEPEAFRPERFLGDYNRDAFVPFAAGPRSCIGRRFSEIESLTFLAHLILKYKFNGTPINMEETSIQMKERLLQWHQGIITLAPGKVPLTFTPRNK